MFKLFVLVKVSAGDLCNSWVNVRKYYLAKKLKKNKFCRMIYLLLWKPREKKTTWSSFCPIRGAYRGTTKSKNHLGAEKFCFPFYVSQWNTIETKLSELTHHFPAHTPPNPHHHSDTLLKLPRDHLHSEATEITDKQDKFNIKKEDTEHLKVLTQFNEGPHLHCYIVLAI